VELDRLNTSRPELQEADNAARASLIEDLNEQDEQLQRLSNDLADVTERVRAFRKYPVGIVGHAVSNFRLVCWQHCLKLMVRSRLE
jgi:hypothetical protein